MTNDFIRRSEAMNKINDIAAEFLKDHTIQCDIAAGVAVNIKNDVIKTLPAADVVEVVHGEWEIIGAYAIEFVDAKCSVCGYVDCFDENGIYKFCPECGAKMDGKINPSAPTE